MSNIKDIDVYRSRFVTQATPVLRGYGTPVYCQQIGSDLVVDSGFGGMNVAALDFYTTGRATIAFTIGVTVMVFPISGTAGHLDFNLAFAVNDFPSVDFSAVTAPYANERFMYDPAVDNVWQANMSISCAYTRDAGHRIITPYVSVNDSNFNSFTANVYGCSIAIVGKNTEDDCISYGVLG